MESNAVSQRPESLPTTLDELSRFVLVGREKLNAVRAEIRAIDKVGLAQEVRQQKLREAQEISEAVLDAEVRIGQLMAKVPKATKGNQYTGKMVEDSAVCNQTKTEVIEQAGFTPKQVQRFETVAAHPEIVEQAKAQARENEEVVSRTAVLNMIKDEKKPHVANNSGCNEWYTPDEYIELAWDVLGEIDLDPASCEFANRTIQAKQYFTVEQDGLRQEWHGRVWMNPPYSAELVQQFSAKFSDEYEKGNIEEGIVLVNNATETNWFIGLVKNAKAVCFPKGRIRYTSQSRESMAPLQGQAFLYFGDNTEKFIDTFKAVGWCATINE